MRHLPSVVKVSALAFAFLFVTFMPSRSEAAPVSDPNTPQRISVGTLPLAFEVNQGQGESHVRFAARANNYNVFLASDETILALRPDLVTMNLIGSNPSPKMQGLDMLPGKRNYFVGSDPREWHVGIPTYARVRSENVYPGIDIVYYGVQNQLEYDFVVSPHSDPSLIRMSFQGIQGLELNHRGDLIIHTETGRIHSRCTVYLPGYPR